MNTYHPFAVSTATNILPLISYNIESKTPQKRKYNKKKILNQSGSGCNKRKKATKGKDSEKLKGRPKSINTDKDKEEHNYIFRNSKYVKKDE